MRGPPDLSLVGLVTPDDAGGSQADERLDALSEACRRLTETDDVETLADVTVDVVERVVDDPVVAVWEHDAGADELVPVAASTPARRSTAPLSDGIGPLGPETTAMAVFREGEAKVVEDDRQVSDRSRVHTSLQTLLMVPLGEHGQVHVGSKAVASFDERTERFVDAVATTAEARLDHWRRERELEVSRDRLVQTEQLADVGGWELDLRTDSVTWTDGARSIHEVADGSGRTLEGALRFYPPEDRKAVVEALNSCRETGDPFDLEVRLVTDEGRERWVEVTGEAVEDDGEVVRLVGAIQDVTEQKERRQQLSVLHRILRHNLRNDLNLVSGHVSDIDQTLEGLEDAAALADHGTGTLRRLLDRVPEPTDDLRADVEALEIVLETLAVAPVGEMRGRLDGVQAAVDDLLSVGDRAGRFQTLLDEDGTGWECRLDETLVTVVEDLTHEYPGAVVESDIAPVAVDGHPDMVSLAIRELLDNALRYADSDTPTVEVQTTAVGPESVTVEVVDSGPGIPDGELEALREGSEGPLVHGSGLGLWLVSWLATCLDGHLAFESTVPCRTAVSLTLPIAGERHSGRIEDDA